MALAFAAVGFKLFGAIGAKIGAAYGFSTKDGNESVEQESDDSALKNKLGMESRWVRHMTIWGAVGGAVGAIIGGILGWARGDRIDKPSDLFKHPLESLGKILGKEPVKKDKPYMAQQTAQMPIEQDVNIDEKPPTQNWKNKLDKAEPASATIHTR